MKRIFRILLILVLLLPLSVKADMGAPMVAPYEVVPASENGAPYYDYEYDEDTEDIVYYEVGIVPAESKVKVSYEMVNDGITYGAFEMAESYYYINLNDFMKIDTTYKIDTELYDSRVNYKGVILSSGGAEMKKGPSIMYNGIGKTIPVGAEVQITVEHGEESPSWVYVTYNGNKGWISILNGAVGLESDDNEYIEFYKDIDVYENLNDESLKIIGSINGYEKIYDYYELDAWSFGYYIEHNGLKGYILNSYIIYEYSEPYEFQFETEVAIRENPNKGAKVLTRIPKMEMVKGFKFVETDDEPYWWYYVEYNGVSGWVPEENIYYGEEEPEIDPEGPAINPDRKTTTTKKAEKENIKKDNDNKKSFSATEVVILCVGTAFVVAATVIVTILLVNKKKKIKVEETSVENVLDEKQVEEVKEEVNNIEEN